MKYKDKAMNTMEHEEELKEVYNRLPFLRIIAENQMLWENLVFISIIWVNIIILFSFREKNMDKNEMH